MSSVPELLSVDAVAMGITQLFLQHTFDDRGGMAQTGVLGLFVGRPDGFEDCNSSFALTSPRHRVLLGGRYRLAHQIVGTVEGRVSRHARGVPANDQSSGRAYLTLSRRDARDCAPGPRRATRRSAQYRTRRTILLRTLFCLSSYVQRYGASAALSAAIMAS